ncbi:3-mercaptopyruvate sulfurtransferase [Pokkaliibacter plantistimulans]|uniref:3-mercaptopyruvate sulfurtransferase n=1 Tax=Pokkaliibacter plantistimulans TaxID=1635171 RepID=A0ABX5LRT7_9GAMM|nr:sulfurtransferase [Pokkaliibacter plantistimulans]PXF29359.1 3-mercaptopyruvate sulfurtransferase [Pokkaliibacter plantistimulans]
MGYETLIDAATVLDNVHQPQWRIVDCRFSLADTEAGRRAYQAGHLPGASYAHLDEDLSSPVTATSGRHPLPDEQAFLQTLGKWGISTDTQVVVYDDTGGATAARLWWLLKRVGHRDVAVLDGGLAAWAQAGGELVTDLPAVVDSGAYPASVALVQTRSADELLAQMSDPRWQLVDARAAERFRGEVEPLDPVAGHIPGAMNRPLQQNLQPDGRFKSFNQLRGEWQALLGEATPKEVVHYCGSGVTACHNLLAMEHAGLTGSRLYPGSWSEWCKDASRPMVTK